WLSTFLHKFGLIPRNWLLNTVYSEKKVCDKTFVTDLLLFIDPAITRRNFCESFFANSFLKSVQETTSFINPILLLS
ncbi:TPA: hypothetical protein ACF3C3_002469, partial [Enterococcus faecium]